MIEIFGVIILTALAVNGVNIASGEGMILEPFKKWLHKVLTKPSEVIELTATMPKTSKLYKPLIGCVKCMPSIYGTIICLCFLPITPHLIYIIPIVILCSSTLATIIHSLYI